jgi:hypothetical protein
MAATGGTVHWSPIGPAAGSPWALDGKEALRHG